jgi:glycosyltransferase involved in cell wall biosynthesis
VLKEHLELSVVIPTYNRRDILAMVVPALLNQDFAESAGEITVVVDGSTDGTLELLSQPAFRRIRVIEGGTGTPGFVP